MLRSETYSDGDLVWSWAIVHSLLTSLSTRSFYSEDIFISLTSLWNGDVSEVKHEQRGSQNCINVLCIHVVHAGSECYTMTLAASWTMTHPCVTILNFKPRTWQLVDWHTQRDVCECGFATSFSYLFFFWAVKLMSVIGRGETWFSRLLSRNASSGNTPCCGGQRTPFTAALCQRRPRRPCPPRCGQRLVKAGHLPWHYWAPERGKPQAWIAHTDTNTHLVSVSLCLSLTLSLSLACTQDPREGTLSLLCVSNGNLLVHSPVRGKQWRALTTGSLLTIWSGERSNNVRKSHSKGKEQYSTVTVGECWVNHDVG